MQWSKVTIPEQLLSREPVWVRMGELDYWIVLTILGGGGGADAAVV